MAKSSAYPPLDSLVDLACRDGVDIRPTLLRVLTDLYVQKPVHSAEEETQYVELALGLIDAVDATTLAVVADRLAAYPAAPAAILGRLGIPSARPAAATAHSDRGQASRRNDLLEIFFAANSRRTPPDPDQSRCGGRNGAAPAGASLERSDPPPGKRGPAAQSRRIRPHARTRARHQPGAGRTHRARPVRRADRGRRRARSA